jgi:hypothetical protein
MSTSLDPNSIIRWPAGGRHARTRHYALPAIYQLFDEHCGHHLHLGYYSHAAPRPSARANAKASLSRPGRDIPRTVPCRSLRVLNCATSRGRSRSSREGLGAVPHPVRAPKNMCGSPMLSTGAKLPDDSCRSVCRRRALVRLTRVAR